MAKMMFWPLYRWETAFGARRTESWADPRVSMVVAEKRKKYLALPGIEPGTFGHSARSIYRQSYGGCLMLFFFIYLVCESIGTAATPGLLCQRRVIVKMIVEEQMECRLAGETEVLGENLPQHHVCPSQNPT
jgi:hypothetical protein